MLPVLLAAAALTCPPAVAAELPRIAVFSGPQATIQNSAPLVTSDKARKKYGLPLLRAADGSPPHHDHLVPQRLAAPVEVFIEQFSAHPLERDAAELYAPPDGYLDAEGRFRTYRRGPEDRPVYRITLKPEDGLYLLPYMARQADGAPWEGDCVRPGAPRAQCRQPFFPDAARIFEEIDRGIAGLDDRGRAGLLHSRAAFDFHRALPSGGYTRGLPAQQRTDAGDGPISPETLGEDFFVYRPFHLRSSVRRQDLALLTNAVQQVMDTGHYAGAVWLEGSPTLEETVYWLNLLVDTPVPIVGNAAQRANRLLSADGPKNIVDAVDYILSRVWADAEGRNEAGVVVIQDEQIFAARQVQKSDARPGGYVATGDHGGILGTMGEPGPVQIYFRPATLHTWRSQLRISLLPERVTGISRSDGFPTPTLVRTKGEDGLLIPGAVPRVDIVKYGNMSQETSTPNADEEVAILARVRENLVKHPLSGFVAEGYAPYGVMARSAEKALEIAAFSGIPVVHVGRGNAGGATPSGYFDLAIGGNNLTATKARMLLIASLLKLGSLPPAGDPRRPTAAEREATRGAVARYQQIFDTH